MRCQVTIGRDVPYSSSKMKGRICSGHSAMEALSDSPPLFSSLSQQRLMGLPLATTARASRRQLRDWK